MAFFNSRKEGVVEVAKVKVAKTQIISSYSYGSEEESRSLKWYFVVYEVNGQYFEVFSGKKIEQSTTDNDEGICLGLDIPYIEYVEPLTKYLLNEEQEFIKTEKLFDFILQMNVLDKVGAFDKFGGCI